MPFSRGKGGAGAINKIRLWLEVLVLIFGKERRARFAGIASRTCLHFMFVIDQRVSSLGAAPNARVHGKNNWLPSANAGGCKHLPSSSRPTFGVGRAGSPSRPVAGSQPCLRRAARRSAPYRVLHIVVCAIPKVAKPQLFVTASKRFALLAENPAEEKVRRARARPRDERCAQSFRKKIPAALLLDPVPRAQTFERDH